MGGVNTVMEEIVIFSVMMIVICVITRALRVMRMRKTGRKKIKCLLGKF